MCLCNLLLLLIPELFLGQWLSGKGGLYLIYILKAWEFCHQDLHPQVSNEQDISDAAEHRGLKVLLLLLFFFFFKKKEKLEFPYLLSVAAFFIL